MKTHSHHLLAALCMTALPLTASLAQTRKPAPKPVAKTAAKPAAAPAAKPAATATPAARAAAQPAPTPAPAATSAAPASAAPAAKATSGAATGAFAVGTNAVNLGIGLGNRYAYGTGFGGGSSSVSPALSVSFERGIIPLGPGVLGVGVFAGYQGANYDFGGGDEWKYTDVIVTLRGAFHYPVTPEFDAYGGLGLGVRRLSSSWSGPANSSYNLSDGAATTDAASGLFVGGRYFFAESIGAFAELGYDQTYLKVGLTAKF
ncbi:hypothetical protein [Hymenobacter sp.]|uniref:hypothetical protein n=1 Tax=Hymenobacter sp. TaxID=1898978 RepID=UPI00286B7F54|nr:hypothetical protein [Hymenobacter sp.]